MILEEEEGIGQNCTCYLCTGSSGPRALTCPFKEKGAFEDPRKYLSTPLRNSDLVKYLFLLSAMIYNEAGFSRLLSKGKKFRIV